MKRILFIINPIAGGISKDKVVTAIGNIIDKEKYLVSIDYTAYAGHATEIAANAAADGVDIVVAVGGDGSVNEVARALVGTSTSLGIVPCGSGNGLARHLHIPVHLTGSLRIINSGFSTVIDSADMNGNTFFCTCGVGYDAKVCNDYTNSGSRGLKTYVEKSISGYFSYRPKYYRITTDGSCEIIRKAFIITCANANQWGNNFHVAPNASLKDGELDLVIIHPINIISAIPMPAQILGFHFDRNSSVEVIRCKKADITCLSPEQKPSFHMEAHYDGEPLMVGKDVHIQVIPSSLNVIVSKIYSKKL